VRILICEDEPDIRDILHSYLTSEGYEVQSAASGERLLQMFTKSRPDLVILDVMLPGIDGWEVLNRLRVRSRCPVIMLTALGRVTDKVKGLSTGADDYITKPFQLEEVGARIAAVLRRSTPPSGNLSLEIDDLRKIVVLRGNEVTLSPKEFALLKLLASHPGRVFSREDILAELWPKSHYATAQDVQKYVYLLRKRIERDPSNPEYILTVRGFGYRLAEQLVTPSP